MRFKPKSDQELAMASLWPDGIYSFEVLKAVDTVSKSSGKDMLALTLKLFDGDKTCLVNDYITEKVEFKLKHFCDATGLEKAYESGEVQAKDCLGKGGKVKIKIGKAQGEYAAKNEVKDYVVKGDLSIEEGDIPNDNIPF